MNSTTRPAFSIVGNNSTPIWGMSAAERIRRIARAQDLDGASEDTLIVNAAFAFDPAWSRYLAKRPDTVLTLGRVPVIAHVRGSGDVVRRAMAEGSPLPRQLAVIDADDPAGIYDEALRKRDRPFVLPLTPENVPAIERASYAGAYKGVTDLLTKYLWPTWAFHLTRLAARIGLSPNGVTAIGTILCVVAAIAFWHGWFWTGMATGLGFMVLDTVDGKLARCTITSSKIGNIWDHGIDLVHPPFWWWAWGVGCAAYGRALGDQAFWWTMAVIVGGYVVQRVIEGYFMRAFGMHIHVWERFDSRFRLVTARRNPNMVILFASLIVMRPDWGIVAVAWWTAISCAIHLVRLVQAEVARARGSRIESWLA